MINSISLDLARGHTPIPVRGKTWMLIRWHDRVLGEMVVDDLDLADADAVERHALARYGAHVQALRTARMAIPVYDGEPEVSLVIAVESRPALLLGCLGAIADMWPPPREVIIIGDESVRPRSSPHEFKLLHTSGDLVSDLDLGWRSASGSTVVFLDERSRPDIRLAGSIANALNLPGVGAAVSLIAPWEFSTHPQFTFDQAGPLPKRTYSPCLWDCNGFDPLRIHPRVNGAVAYRRTLLEETGGFDVVAKRSSRRMAEYAMLQALVETGHVIAQSPDAVNWHVHPRTRREVLDWIRSETADRMTWLRHTGASTLPANKLVRDQIAGLTRSLRRRRWFDLQVAAVRLAGSAMAPLRRVDSGEGP